MVNISDALIIVFFTLCNDVWKRVAPLAVKRERESMLKQNMVLQIIGSKYNAHDFKYFKITYGIVLVSTKWGNL